MSDTVILVPRRADNGRRDQLWEFARPWWPDYPVVEGYHEEQEGPFNRAVAINRAAAAARDWEVAVVIDSDVLPNDGAVEQAVEVARTKGAASAFTVRNNLSRKGTDRVLNGFRGNWRHLIQSTWPDCVSGALAVNRELWHEIGGFDEAFIGWGYEDVAFRIAIDTLTGELMHKVDAPLWHLWHMISSGNDWRTAQYQKNKVRCQRYIDAHFQPALLKEARHAAPDD